ncbi:MAG TPA: PCRF domain-containing protein, partial [Candidatus Saccharimonadales bacterium]|nr:PCRF domain-containing protein [Candidatus Saccharimonadales bacterium]
MEEKERALRQELTELDAKLQDPAVFADKDYPKLAKRKSQLDELIALFDTKKKLAKDKLAALDLQNNPDAELQQMAAQELAELEKQIAANEETLVGALTPQDP